MKTLYKLLLVAGLVVALVSTVWSGAMPSLTVRGTATAGYTTTGNAAYINATELTTGNALKILAVDATLNGGYYLNCYGGTGTTSVLNIGEGGIVTFKGGATMDNATSASILNLTETTVRVTGAFDVTENSTLASLDVGGGSGGSGATITAAGAATFDGLITGGAGATVTGVLTGKYDAAAYWTATTADGGATTFDQVSDGTDGFIFGDPVTFNATGETAVVSTGLLGGAGTSGTHASLGAGGSGVKGFSYYLSTTSITAAHSQTGLYLNMDYGVGATDPAPSGDAIRGRAYLNGDASGAVALTGGAFTTEVGAGATHTGLLVGMRGNVVFPDEAIGAAGTWYGTMAELYTGGASTDTTALTDVSPLGIVIAGTAPTSAAQLGNVSVISITVPTNEVGDGLIVDNAATTAHVAYKIRARINGTVVWLLADNDHD